MSEEFNSSLSFPSSSESKAIDRPSSSSSASGGEGEAVAALLPSDGGDGDATHVKLTGYDFFRSIGSPRFVVAPMVDHSELAFRLMTRRYGAHLVYTQMFNANTFVNSSEYCEDNFTTCAEDRPLIVQFASHEPEVLLRAAKLVEDKCDAVDINLGCPQAIAKRGRYGAWLMEELDLLRDMVTILAKNLKIPVTCKTRIYQGPGGFERSIRLCETLVNAGASMLTLHGRTREQKGQLCGGPDWETLRRIKAHFGDRVPIIANGGIMTLDDIQKCMEYTKCDGVMTSEGILENPALFVNRIDPRTGLYRNQLDLTDEYLDIVSEYPAWHMRTVRSHVHKFLFRYVQKFPEFRDRVGEAHEIEQFRQINKEIRERVGTEEPTFLETWYLRYRSQDPTINPILKHQKHTHSARISTSLLEAADDLGYGDGCSSSGGEGLCGGGDMLMNIFNSDD